MSTYHKATGLKEFCKHSCFNCSRHKGPTLCLLEKHTFSGHRDSRKKLEIKPAIPTSLCQLLKLLMCKEECCRALMCVFSTEREKERVWIWGGRKALGEDGGCEIRTGLYCMGKCPFSIFKTGKENEKKSQRDLSLGVGSSRLFGT